MCVQVSGGLVRQDNFRFVDDGPRDGHALLLAAGNFRRPVLQAVGEAEHLGDDLKAVRVKAVAVNVLRDGDVAAGVERRQQVEPLKNEADLVPPQLGAFGVAHGGQIVAVHQDAPPRSLRQPSQHIEQRRFAAAGRPHHADEFSGQHFEIHAAQRRNFHLSRVVQLPKIFGNDYRFHSLDPLWKAALRQAEYCSRDWHF